MAQKPYNGPLIYPVPVRIPAFEERMQALLDRRGRGGRVEIARKTGVCRGLLTEYIKGKHLPTLAVAVAIADALNVSLDYLAGRTDEMKGGMQDAVVD